MSKKSDNAYHEWRERLADKSGLSPYPFDAWDAGIAYAAKQQEDRDARIKDIFAKYAGEEAIKMLCDIMEGKL